MSAILRHRHPNRFTVLPNDAIRNPRLSFRAVGVLAHLLSLPDGAKVDSATLAGAHREGRDAIRAAYRELEAHGYYRREVLRLADGTLRTDVVVSSTPMRDQDPGRTDDGFSGVGPKPDDPASVEPASVHPTSVEPTPVDQAPTEVPRTEELFSPPTPRTAGGGQVEQVRSTAAGRRAGGTNPRATGTHPRAATEQAETARLEAEAAARQAALQRATETRRASDQAAEAEAERIEAEALAVSAALDDATLTAVVQVVTETMAGPLARSPLAISRAVVAWCRRAATQHAGPLAEAAAAGLVAGIVVGDRDPPALLDAPPAPPGTALLRHRIAAMVRRGGGER